MSHAVDRLTRPIALCCALFVFSISSTSFAQIRFAIDTDPQFDAGKLAPDLYVAARTGAIFLGITPEGEAVLEFPADMDEDAILRSLADVRGLRGARSRAGQDFELLTQIVAGVGRRVADFDPGERISGLPIVDVFEDGNFIVIESDGGFSGPQLEELEANNVVEYAEPNYSYQLAATPNDEHYPLQWGVQSGTPRSNAPLAWDEVTESDIVVAVIDTGIRLNHPDLRANLWINEAEQQGNPAVDDDGNGYIDDIHGVDLVANTGNPMDTSGHGTHCAGIIGAQGNNRTGVAGVCWSVPMMAVRVFQTATSKAPSDRLAKAMYYAVNNGAKVINCSWGGYKSSDAVLEAIHHAERQGCLVVCAAGNGRSRVGGNNDADPYYPASYAAPNIISVLAITKSGALPNLSNYGQLSVDLGAPGVSVYSTLAEVSYGYSSGTSMAAPHVSGAAALIWNHPRTGKTYTQVKAEILACTAPLPSLYQKCVTGGTLDLSCVE